MCLTCLNIGGMIRARIKANSKENICHFFCIKLAIRAKVGER